MNRIADVNYGVKITCARSFMQRCGLLASVKGGT